MDTTTHDTILESAHGSIEGRLHFGEVIGLLIEAGVEAYFADYRAGRTTYFLPDGETLDVMMQPAGAGIPLAFDGGAVKAAILGAQQGTVMYPQFKQRTQQAGCVGYMVWIAGRHVTYYGRQGETHVERFPD